VTVGVVYFVLTQQRSVKCFSARCADGGIRVGVAGMYDALYYQCSQNKSWVALARQDKFVIFVTIPMSSQPTASLRQLILISAYTTVVRL
jgi:hypothetical protein